VAEATAARPPISESASDAHDAAGKQAHPPDTTNAAAPPGTGVSSTPPPALTEFEQRARTEFERAQRSYDLGRFEEAIVHYSRAYEAMALPPFLFNIAQCHRLLGEYAQAAFFYRRYLDLAGNPPNAALARELLGEMEQRQSDHERLERETGARVRAALTAHPERPEDLEPLYRRWWFWAAVGGGVVAGMTAVTVVSSQPSRTTLGTLDSR
jgi:tetratricopeptide (TPR) repeat protein